MSISTFTGEYPGSIDKKGRLIVPSRLRKVLPRDKPATFVVTRWLDPCLVAYPEEEWVQVAERLKSLPISNKKNRAFIRAFVRNAAFVECDKQGRITIPQRLLEMVNIKENVVMIGALNKIEIWAPEVMETYALNKLDLEDESFEDLGNGVF